MRLEGRKGFWVPNKAASCCHLWGHRPRSAVSHLYFSLGATVPAQTTYLVNQSQLRQSLTAQIQGIEANGLLSREPSLIFWSGRLKFVTKFHPAVTTTSTPWSPKVKDEHQQSSDRHRHLIIESLLWTVKVDLTKSATCFSIRAALQCKCSTSVFFDLNEDMVLRNMSLYAIHSNKVGGLQHLCLSRFTSSALHHNPDGVVVFALLWFPKRGDILDIILVQQALTDAVFLAWKPHTNILESKCWRANCLKKKKKKNNNKV